MDSIPENVSFLDEHRPDLVRFKMFIQKFRTDLLSTTTMKAVVYADESKPLKYEDVVAEFNATAVADITPENGDPWYTEE